MNKWTRIRKELYLQLKKEVSRLVGTEDLEIQNYRKDFEELFFCKWKNSDLKQLFESMESSDLVYLADFHALRQSQRSHLRILRQWPEGRPLFLALECFSFEHHYELEQFLSGQINEQQLLKMTRWDQTWGFPWDHYKPILDWVLERRGSHREAGIAGVGPWVYGINPPAHLVSQMSLKERDQYVAEKIMDLKSHHSAALGVVIIGEMHLTKNHLLGEVRALGLSRDTVIYQNSDEIYFRLLSKNQEHKVNVLKKSKSHEFCLISSPPWVKWQNYLLYLEQQYDQTLDDEIDYTDHVYRYYKILVHDFQIPNPRQEFSIESPSDSRVWLRLAEKFSSRSLSWLSQWIENSKSFYIPELRLGFIGNPSVNHASELAMMILHFELGGYDFTPLQFPQKFLELIWIEAIRYTGVKWINPQRKTDTLKDLQLQIKFNTSKKTPMEVLQLALYQKMKELIWVTESKFVNKSLARFKPRQKSSFIEAARILGGMMGEKIHHGLKESLLSTEELLLWMSYPISDVKFPLFYKEVVCRLHSLPEPFSSKREKL